MADCLIIIDLQNGLQTEDHRLYELDQVLAVVNNRIADYRINRRPIIFIQHEDSDLVPATEAWQLMPELDNRDSDFYVGKTHANSFYCTALTTLLNELNVKEIEFCGAQSQYCVDTTVRVAHGLGYKLTMANGSTTTLDSNDLTAKQIIDHHEAIWDKRFLTFI